MARRRRPPPRVETPQQRAWLAPVALLLLTLVTYIPVYSAGFIWDDDAHVTANATLRTIGGLGDIWFKPLSIPQYYPLVHTTFWIEYHLWGLHPLGYHVVNVLLHAANAVLVWTILKRLAVPGAFLAALIFALHPVHVESVAWVTERKNVLSALFYLSAMLVWLRHWSEAPKTEAERPTWRSYAAIVLLFVCALLSKTVTCSLPAAMLVIQWWRFGKITRRDLIITAPLFLLGIASGVTTVLIEKHHVGAQGEEWNFTSIDRILIAGRAVWFYAFKLIVPYPLSFIYPRWTIDAYDWWQYLYPLAAVALVVAAWLARKRVGRGPLAALLYFGGTLVPALGFFDVYPMRYSFVADHFQYLASLGLIVLLAAGLTTAVTRFRWPAQAAALVALPLAIVALYQTTIYANKVTLWSDTIAKDPNSWMGYGELAQALGESNRPQEAIGYFEASLRLRPNDANTHKKLGVALAQLGRLQDAEKQFERALELDPNIADLHDNYGETLVALGRHAEARRQFEEALRLRADSVSAHSNLGRLLAVQGHLDEALAHVRRAVEIEPDSAQAQSNLGAILELRHDWAGAEAAYREAVRVRPGFVEAHYNLAQLLQGRGRPIEAAAEYRAVLALEPRTANALNNLGTIYLNDGELAPAIAHFQAAIQVDPQNTAARRNLALALQRQHH